MKKIYLVLTLLQFLSSTAYSETKSVEHTVSQKDKQFSQSEITISVGDTVHFLNEDPFYHNIYAMDGKTFFDLGSYPKGEKRSHTFSETGKVRVECALHPDMKLIVNITQ